MTVSSARLSQGKAEFTVEDAQVFDRSSPLRWVLSHLWRHKLYLLGFFVCSATMNTIHGVLPRLTGMAFDEVLSPVGGAGALLNIAALYLGLVMLRGVLDLAASWSMEISGQRLVRGAREELYLSLLGKSQTFHQRQRVGDVMARANDDVRQLNPMMSPGVSLIFESMSALVISVAFIASLRLELLLAPLVFIVVFFFALRLYMRQLNPVSGAMRRQFGVLNAGLNETITGIEVVKASVQEAQERGKFMNHARAFRDLFVRQGLVQARYLPLLFLGVIIAGAFAHGLLLLSRGELTTGELVAYMGFMGLLRFPAFISIFTFSLVQLGLAGAERILELMRSETELDQNVGGHAEPIRGEIIFDDVDFAYEGSEEGRGGLRGVSFRAQPGTTVAIVGQTGSGKSTLTKLVNRSYDVSSGRILVDGVDLREWDLESLRSQISVIEQDVFLFSRSVAENIGFGLGERATREAIVEAAKAAQAHDFISHFADGYDTVVGERGVTLSGGQRQRLAIARALLTDPKILILDDATSAIDSATEDAIQKAIDVVLQGRTTLMITHRLSQIRRADLVLLMQGGRIVDQGSHQELLERSPHYQRIFARYD